ncbi:MAG: hypothetical protein HRU23_07955 [Gammaproteobacteria bacterium]|nr:hypothetical protein [Gammaproteobacteria bacterium]
MKQQDIIFFEPLWRRIAVTAFCLLWSVFEWLNDESFWGMISGGFAIYCYWSFFRDGIDQDQVNASRPED